jgi:superfamily II DNA or RNA helicase
VTQAVLGGGLYFRPGEGDQYARVFRVKNKAYDTALRLRERGRRLALPPRWAEAAGRLPEGHPWAGGVVLPRAVRPPGIQIVDKRTLPSTRLDIKQRVDYVLRSYQRDAIAAAIRSETALLVAPTGSGKTTIGAGLIAELRTRTLILVHTKDLAAQWADRLSTEERPPPAPRPQLAGDFTIGMVGDGQDDRTADIVIATVQTLTKWGWSELYDFGKGFGLTLLDEAHHAPAETFGAVLGALPSKYRCGLTATPERDDGLTDILLWHFGKPAWTVSLRALADAGQVLLPDIEWLKYEGAPPDYEGVPEWADLIDTICGDADRNEAITLRVRIEAMSKRKTLVLTSRVEHAEALAEQLRAAGLRARAIHGKAKDREETITLARAGELDVVVGTSVADEGLDIPCLDTLLLASPSRSLGKLAQRVGRILRPLPGKEKPRVIDVVDVKHGVCVAQGRARHRFYEKTYG